MNKNSLQIVCALGLAMALVGAGCGKTADKAAADKNASPNSPLDMMDGPQNAEIQKQAAEHQAKFAKADVIEVKIGSDGFVGGPYKLKLGHPYKLTISTSSTAEHVVRIGQYSIATVVTAKSGAVTYDIAPDKAGKFDVVCSNHKSEKTQIIVE